MKEPSDPVPVPHDVARRAWECAFDLAREKPEGLNESDADLAAEVARRNPDAPGLSWLMVRHLFAIHRLAFDGRKAA